MFLGYILPGAFLNENRGCSGGSGILFRVPMIVTAARYDNSAGKPGYYKVDEKKLENGIMIMLWM